MTAINVQIQPDRSPSMDVSSVVTCLTSLDPSSEVSEGFDNGRYINIYFSPVDANAVWKEIRGQLTAKSELARAAIVTCEGRHGWDDYLLLFHFDRTLTLDDL